MDQTHEDRMNGTTRSAQHAVHGLLTPDTCVLALVDYQPQTFFAAAGMDRQSILNNVVGLAKPARALNVPVVLASIERESFSGNTLPILLAALDNPEPVGLPAPGGLQPTCDSPAAWPGRSLKTWRGQAR
jgi:nicotinamidase-related amidase